MGADNMLSFSVKACELVALQKQCDDYANCVKSLREVFIKIYSRGIIGVYGLHVAWVCLPKVCVLETWPSVLILRDGGSFLRWRLTVSVRPIRTLFSEGIKVAVMGPWIFFHVVVDIKRATKVLPFCLASCFIMWYLYPTCTAIVMLSTMRPSPESSQCQHHAFEPPDCELGEHLF